MEKPTIFMPQSLLDAFPWIVGDDKLYKIYDMILYEDRGFPRKERVIKLIENMPKGNNTKEILKKAGERLYNLNNPSLYTMRFIHIFGLPLQGERIWSTSATANCQHGGGYVDILKALGWLDKKKRPIPSAGFQLDFTETVTKNGRNFFGVKPTDPQHNIQYRQSSQF